MKLHICLILVLVGAHCTFAETVSSPVTLKVKLGFQQKLEAFMVFYDGQVKRNPEMTEKEFDTHLTEFLKNSGLAGGDLLAQLAVAYGKRNFWQHKLLVRALLGEAQKQLTAEEAVAQIAPYYELTMSGELREVLNWILYEACIEHGTARPDYRPVVSYIQQSKDAPPVQLVRYMFKLNPDKALPEVEKVYAQKPKCPSKQFKGDSIQKVRSVASGSKWWQELYAAEKMRQNKNLRDPELIEQLKKSKNPVVSAAIQEILGEKGVTH